MDETATLFNTTSFMEINDTTSSPTSSSLSRSCDVYRFVMSVAVIGLTCLLGIIGNGLAVAVLRKYDQESTSYTKSSTSLLLSALAVCDMLVLASVFLMKTVPSFCSFTGLMPGFFDIYPYLLLYGWPFVDLAHAYSTWVTVLVSCHRYVAVCKPHKAAFICTAKAGARQVVAVIIFCTVFELPVFLDNSLVTQMDANNQTVLVRVLSDFALNNYYQLVYKTTLYYILMYAIPLGVLMVVSAYLIPAIKRASRQRAELTGRDLGQRNASSDDITGITLVIVIICILCNPWEPVRRIIEAVLLVQPGCGHFYFWYEEFPSLSFAINSAANFIVYCCMGSKFRKRLSQIFSQLCRCGKRFKKGEAYGMDTSSGNSTVGSTLSTVT